MNHIDHDFIAAFDVDGTLIKVPPPDCDVNDIFTVTDPNTGTVKIRVKHQPNIELMKSYKARGFFIVVWSHGGSKWAKAVVEKLGLTDIVDQTQAKPNKMVDDLPVEKGLGHTIFVSED